MQVLIYEQEYFCSIGIKGISLITDNVLGYAK